MLNIKSTLRCAAQLYRKGVLTKEQYRGAVKWVAASYFEAMMADRFEDKIDAWSSRIEQRFRHYESRL